MARHSSAEIGRSLPPRTGRTLGRCLAGAMLLIWGAALGAAESAGPSEAELKAAVVYQVARYVEWPAAKPTNAPLVVGLAGEGPLIQALAALLPSAKPVLGRPLKALLLQPAAFPANAISCHVVVVGEGINQPLAPLLKYLTNAHQLTISDLDAFCAQGGMVGLRMAGRRVELDVNWAACERAQLRLSSRVLRQARLIHPPPQR